ncbi:autoinducer synthase [Erythrobacter sp. QSSC1-22B]|nr:autoinducer synthase [Erythrobacter sp. QSSC1-22B]
MQNSSENHRIAICDPVLRAMFDARKRVFVDLLKWEVPILDDAYEIDQFDTPEAVYIVLTGECGAHRASARLLRTDRSHILGGLFPVLCYGPVPVGDDLREITRFCIEPTLTRIERRLARNQLVTALVDHARAYGISGYTAVATRGWFDQISNFGWRCRALGPGSRIGSENLVALEIGIDRDTAEDLSRGGVYLQASYRVAGPKLELAA